MGVRVVRVKSVCSPAARFLLVLPYGTRSIHVSSSPVVAQIAEWHCVVFEQICLAYALPRIVIHYCKGRSKLEDLK